MHPGECALDFTEMVADIRTQLESVVSNSADKSINEDLKLKYGTDLFKCPRFGCKYFTHDFASQSEHDTHVERHERPARCTDRHCAGFIIGFASQSQLAKHLKDTHSDSTDQDHSFPTEEEVNQSLREYSSDTSDEPEEIQPFIAEHLPVPELEPEMQADSTARSSRPMKRTKTLQEYECSHCSKKFTKRYNWQSHLKMHRPSQILSCSKCGTTCAREGDLNRHMKKHMGSNAFTCGGVSENGKTWECGQRFNRADILRNHYKSKKGKKCIAALNEEEQAQVEDL